MDWTQLLIALLGGGGLGALVSYLTSRHQAALERGKIEQQVEDSLWQRTQEDREELRREIAELRAENKETRQELMGTKQELMETKQELLEAKQEIASLRLENDTLRQANDALRSELQAAKKRQEDAEVRHIKDVKELLEANVSMERELREVRGRMRKVESNTGPLQ